jgi:hypothetical protein
VRTRRASTREQPAPTRPSAKRPSPLPPGIGNAALTRLVSRAPRRAGRVLQRVLRWDGSDHVKVAEGETPANHTLVYVPGQRDNVWVPTDQLATYPEAYTSTPASAPPLEHDQRIRVVLDEAASEIPDGPQAAELAERLSQYGQMMAKLLSELDSQRESTQEYVWRRIGDAASDIAEGRAPRFDAQAFLMLSDQERLAQQLIHVRKNQQHFKDILAPAKHRIDQSGGKVMIEFHLGNIRLGEVTAVALDDNTAELHFNVEEPLQYIGVASELWPRGIAVLESAVPGIAKMDVILPSFSGASTLMVARRLAQIGGNVAEFQLGEKAAAARKGQKDTASSAERQHKAFKAGKDESTDKEVEHYLRSVAMSLYKREYGLVGYVNPWDLLKVYGVDYGEMEPDTVQQLSEAMMAGKSTLAGYVEIATCHKLLKLKYDPGKFVEAVATGMLKLKLGVRGETLIDFSLERVTWASVKRYVDLKL